MGAASRISSRRGGLALGGSCCSSCCSTRNSRDRWLVRVREELAPIAFEVFTPHAVLRLIPSVIDSVSLVPHERLPSRLLDPVCCANGPNPARLWPVPRLRPVVSLVEADTETESAAPMVLV